MARHGSGLGLRSNGQAGAPVVGVERTQIGSASDVRQRGIRETDTKAAAKSETNIPQFKDNPIGAIGIILQEVAAGMKGTAGPVAAAHRQAIEQQSFQLRKDAQTLQAIKFGMAQLEAFPGGDRGALVATITKISPEAGAVLGEMSKAAVEKSRAILDLFDQNPEMFPGAAKLARLVGVEKAVEIYGGIASEVAEQKALAPGRVAEAGDTAGVTEAVKAKFREPKAPVLRSGLGGAVIDIDTGEVVTPGSLNVIDQATGKPQTIPITSAEDLKRLTDRLASGEIVEGRIQRTREITDIPGAVRILLPDLPADMTPEQARLKGINIDLRPQTLEGLLENRGDAQQLDSTFTELQEIIAENPAAVGTAGTIARIGNSIIAQLPLIALLAGTEYDPELLVPENYESTFREIGIESQRGRSATLGAAYALALAQRRRGGRVAQQDIERALNQIGGTFGQDPGATIQILQDLKQRTAEGFQTRAASMLGRRPPRIEITPSPAISKSSTIPRLSTQEEVDNLAPGTRFFWVPTKEGLTKE